MHVAVLGNNHKLSDVAYREKWMASISELLKEVKVAFSYVLLFSCNRCEIYFHASDLMATAQWLKESLVKKLGEGFHEKNYLYMGQECFLHLSLVASGLNSAQLGETDIRRQVREAYRKSQETGNLSSDLHFLFQKSLKIGKQAVMYTSDLAQQPSLEQVIFEQCLQTFDSLQGKRVFFWGNSQMTRKMIHYLSRKADLEFIICSKTNNSLSNSKKITFVDHSEFEAWKESDIVFSATHQHSQMITSWDRSIRTRLICDLSVPRSISLDLSICSEVSLLNMDHFNALLQKNHLLHGEQVQKIKAQIEVFVERSFLIFAKKTRVLQLLQGNNVNGCCISL